MFVSRVGDVSFVALLEKSVLAAFRVVHHEDWVAHLPPCCATFHFGQCSNAPQCPYHHSTEIWYDNTMGLDADFIICKSSEVSLTYEV